MTFIKVFFVFMLLGTTSSLSLAQMRPTVRLHFLFAIPCSQESFDGGEQGLVAAALNDSLVLIQTGSHVMSIYSLAGKKLMDIVHQLPRPATYIRWDSITARIVIVSVDRRCWKDSIYYWQIDTNGRLHGQHSFKWNDCTSALSYAGFASKQDLQSAKKSLGRESSKAWICRALQYDPSFNFLTSCTRRFLLYGRLDRDLKIDKRQYGAQRELSAGRVLWGVRYWDSETRQGNYCYVEGDARSLVYEDVYFCPSDLHQPKARKLAMTTRSSGAMVVLMERAREIDVFSAELLFP